MAVSFESNTRVSQRFKSHGPFSFTWNCASGRGVHGVSGNGTLATVVFYAKDVGECQSHLYEVTLLNSAQLQIDCITQDSYGTFTPQMDGGGGGRVPYLT